jgi:VIT1/CCC1 family predicted Fe2+/Mn2+ transporter
MNTSKIRQSTNFSFGSTSAIITNIALIIGLDTAANAKYTIIGSLLVIALADNVSDSLGIHVFQESEGLSQKNVWISTLTNFLSRFVISLGFILIILIFPLKIAVGISIIYGLAVLSSVTYLIARVRKINSLWAMIEHLVIALSVIFISNFLGKLIISNFR